MAHVKESLTQLATEASDNIKRHLKELLTSQRLAVVATHASGQPYASLVAFVVSDDLKYFLLVTSRHTRKFANLTADPRVALLVNSSTNQESDFHRAASVTVTGTAEEIVGSQRDRLLQMYLAKHPYLEEFAKSPTCALIRIHARSFYLVRNFQNVMELHFPP